MSILLAFTLLFSQAGEATYYHESLHNNTMGCKPYNRYSIYDETIIAVGPADYARYPCGTHLRITGPSGSIVGTRQDSCPGCIRSKIDLSSTGFQQVCGSLEIGRCNILIEVIE